MQVGAALALVLLLGVAFPARALPVNQPPSPPIINYPTYSSWYAKENLTLTARYLEQGGAQQLNWTWSWGDGTYTNATGTAANGTSTATHAWSAAANYTVSVSVSDGYNPVTPGYPIYVNVSLDSISPVTMISAIGLRGNGVWYIGPVTVTLSATDTGAGVASTTYRQDGGPWQTYTAPFQVQAQGNHTLDYRSVDRAGNVETAHTALIPIDSLAPTLVVATPLNGSVLATNSVSLRWTAADSGSGIARVLVSLDGGVYAPVLDSSITLTGLTDGTHTVRMRAADVAGNMATTSITFTVETGTLAMGVLLVGGIAAVIGVGVVVTVLFVIRRSRRSPPSGPPRTPPTG